MGIIDYDEWKDIMMAAETNYTLRKLIPKLRNTYYMIDSKRMTKSNTTLEIHLPEM
ncbi:MAG: hypothetical protein CM15mP106_4540 [Candidatus Neomarinimicrobiota bacterium]|nr:MAG: hypothetical protein CM15mP106_4540 [Candidatus Neomarinimicrobiota bacterium]